ncbi:sulfotransferase family protein [Roseimaritima sediminicola]|uniref:sulfotransferase family protein n=1 Tax=Roseimaritima sediminicola TaxID=2662066 RepID=UPI00192A3D5E|nr:sulfotransferase [Roseimaritima sediminicola]
MQPPRPTHPTGASAAEKPPKQAAEYHPYPFYSPRFWHGMRTGTWWRLLAENRWRAHPSRWAMVGTVSMAAPFNDSLWLLQQALYGRRLRNAELVAPPLFILGHWRSGTTLLHELVNKDPRLGCPSTYQCFAPHHFLVSEWFFRTFASWLLPSKRPMDNMEAGWDRPQEDEFALMNLGAPSPYRRIAFPNNPPPDLQYLDWTDIDPQQEQQWVDYLRRFLLAVSYRSERRVVLKSPTHTGRIGVLSRAFPGAKFLHITRDPRSLFPSTCRLWQSLDQVQAFQVPDPEPLEAYVIECFRRMYTGFHRDVDALSSDQIVHVRYEDLVADPVATLEHIYDALQLDDFAAVRPELQAWADNQHREYKTNRHHLPAETEARIKTEWADYFERYGYL